jgi:hypothetical protein
MQEAVMRTVRGRSGLAEKDAIRARDIGSLAVLFGVVGFIVFLAWGAGPNASRTAAHTPVTRAETTGAGGSYALPRRPPPSSVTDAIELTR